MLTTLKLLELVKKSAGNCTDYRAAQLLEIRRQTISMWIARGSVMDDATGLKAAKIAGISEEYVLASLAAERAKNTESFPLWKRIANNLDPKKLSAAAALFAVAMVFQQVIPGLS